MKDFKTVIFELNVGRYYKKEEVQFDLDTTEKEIDEIYDEWVAEQCEGGWSYKDGE